MISGWKRKRWRKRVFREVTGTARICLLNYYLAQEEFPNASKEELYKLVLYLYPYSFFTKDRIHFFLEEAKILCHYRESLRNVLNEVKYKIALDLERGNPVGYHVAERVFGHPFSENSLQLLDVVYVMIFAESQSDIDELNKRNPLKSKPDVFTEKEPELEDTFCTYYELVAHIIPNDI